MSLTGRMPLVTNSMFAAIFANGVEFRLFNHVANDDGSAAGSAEGDAKLCSVRGSTTSAAPRPTARWQAPYRRLGRPRLIGRLLPLGWWFAVAR